MNPDGSAPFGNYVTPDYFATTGTRLVAGRAFREDERTRTDVVIVNKLGLHARAAAKLVNLASQFKSEITVTRNGTLVVQKGAHTGALPGRVVRR